MRQPDVSLIQVREYATLSLEKGEESLDFARISDTTYEWLVDCIEDKKLYAQIGGSYIKLNSQVGYIEAPDGQCIEILPKIESPSTLMSKDERINAVRNILQEMVAATLHLKGKKFGSGHLKPNQLAIHEWIYFQFLTELIQLLKLGLRGRYELIPSEERFLRGKLNLNEVIRQRPGKSNYFPLFYDQFNYSRIENRLIKSALEIVFSHTKENGNGYLANEFSQRMAEISALDSSHYNFGNWEESKLMQHYEEVFPWCRLILERINPTFSKGKRKGLTFLFKMDELFENYVGLFLLNNLKSVDVGLQKRPYFLLYHTTKGGVDINLFNLQPDITIMDKNRVIIADTKWKIINESLDNSTNKYNISQSDIYQMLGYGYRYQHEDKECRDLLLIYPYSETLSCMLPPFYSCAEEDKQLRLWVIPFAFGFEAGAISKGLVVDYNLEAFQRSHLFPVFHDNKTVNFG